MAAAASGGDTPKQLLSIIRDFAYEKSHGERRVSDLRRRLADARAAADVAAAELDAAKRAREAAEQEFRGSQVQDAIAADSILALEATISCLHEEISKASTDLDALKICLLAKTCFVSFNFVTIMLSIERQFQQMVSLELAEYNHCELPSTDERNFKIAQFGVVFVLMNIICVVKLCEHVKDKSKTVDSEGISEELSDKVSNIEAEVQLLEEEYKKDLLYHDKVRQELAEVQAKRALMEAVMEETKQLQELGEYPEHTELSVPMHF
ncbi:hypothetical protein ZEAMMB73_Zm00001d037270 [Zea mays]|uniref:Uncharacterized protein n=1 Tax=Zea mays TaxID=4577 RepID=A0A1D6LW36_MAIZE|nr:hypothetical protein ZEAMMB73_Zm00001d037270 [Zea mays]